MTEHRIVARDMRTALKAVRSRFGEDALILETRTLRRPRAGSLRLAEEVEVRVALLDKGESAVQDAPTLSLEAELARLEGLLADMEAQFEAAERPEHPLAATLTALGLLPESLLRLARDHAEEVPPLEQSSGEAALDRLAACLPCVEAMGVEDLRGTHALLGAPGSGRSTLAMKLCARAAAAGLEAVHLAVAPSHPGERQRLEAEAQALGHEAVLAPDGPALLEALHYLRNRDLVVIDLPAFTAGQTELLRRAEAAASEGPLLCHAVLPADGRALLPPALAATAHYLAITRADLDDPLRLALDLTAAGQPALSFLAGGAGAETPLELATPARLLAGLRARQQASLGAGAGARR